MLSGKSRKEVYEMMTDEEKSFMKDLAPTCGITRQQRRKQERDAKRKLH